MDKDKIYKTAIKKFGTEKQVIVAIEELSELIQALTKSFRNTILPKVSDNIIEEIADCIIVLEQLQRIFDIRMSVVEEYNKKLRRLEKLVCQNT